MYSEEFHTELWLPRPPEKIFPFFADAANLEALTPPWLRFRVVTATPIEMSVGALIDYRLRVHGVPIRWRTRITAWDPPHSFTDEQIRGPYRLWIHQHTFEPSRGGTLARDIVRFASPGGRLMHWLLVRRDVKRIFDFRAGALQRIFVEGNQ
jgi:ligand-binding SRPBCC domain-containing protein